MAAKTKDKAARRRDGRKDDRSTGFGLAAAVVGGAAVSALGLVLLAFRRNAEADGHAAPDLASGVDVTADTRAPEHFRPDPTAVPTAEEREALRPATGPAPGFAADRGSFAAGPARADA